MSNDKELPNLHTDKEAEAFIEQADLTEYDISGFTPMHYELQRKTKQVNIRMPDALLEAVKAEAEARHIPYQRFIREAIERALQ